MTSGAGANQEWYADGLRFECTQCGACCTGAPGYVAVSEAEAKAMARELGMTHEEFDRRYTRKMGHGRSLREVQSERGNDCVFLDFDARGLAICKVYKARPLQCRTFPWWPENLKSQAAWTRTGRGCEGIGRGDFVPVEKIRIQRDAQAADAGIHKQGPNR
ncbi:MAG: YkgJ family cysteine cluster protein [Phycisphaerales bacterium]